MYVELSTAKQHLNIDSSYTAEDVYISYLVEVATEVVEQTICQPLEDVADASANIPTPLQHAILLYVGELYNSREVNTYGITASPVPFAFQYLTDMYKCYADYTSEAFEAHVADEIIRHMLIDDETGVLTIDLDYLDYCNQTWHDSLGKAKRRVLLRMCANTYVDEDGNLQIKRDNIG